MIASAKSPLQLAERCQRVRLLITTKMRLLLAPSIFQTAPLVGWKGLLFAVYAETLNFCYTDTQQH